MQRESVQYGTFTPHSLDGSIQLNIVFVTSEQWTHFPSIHVDKTFRLSSKKIKSASESKSSVPLDSSILRHFAGCKVAASMAYTVEQPRNRYINQNPKIGYV